MNAAGSGSFLLFHRGGGLWGIDSGRVARIGAGRGGETRSSADPNEGALRVELDSKPAAGADSVALAADRVEGIVADLAFRPLPSVLRNFWPESGCGIAVHGGRPVILLDPLRLPLPLVARGEPDA